MKRKTEIRFSTDKKGRRRAHYWSWQCSRWFPIGIDVAEFKIATGEAFEHVPYVRQEPAA